MSRPTRHRASRTSTSSSSGTGELHIVALDVGCIAVASALAVQLGIARRDSADESGLCIEVSSSECLLRVPGFAQPLVLAADAEDIRRRAAAGRRLELLRACGWPVAGKRILDATAGLGRDAFVLAAAGAAVDMVERDPVVCALLGAALHFAPIDRKLWLHPGDARERLPQLFADHDVIYLDPMFERNSSALPQREAQVLARLVQQDDGASLLASAIALRPRRVVVKRARTQAPLLAYPAPHHRILGRSVRFDVYAPAHATS